MWTQFEGTTLMARMKSMEKMTMYKKIEQKQKVSKHRN
jgi:hypothetical protein